MADNSYKLEFTLSNGRIINAGTIVAPQGEAGKNGVTFIPSVSEAGVLSWTNDGGLANPDPVNIKGDAAVITESDVAGWGFTKNAGTITEIKMNGSSKGTSGVVDLGTVLTEHQSLENYVTLDGDVTQNITGKKSFTNTIVKKSTTIDLNAKPTSGTQWNYIEFTDKNNDRIGIAGSRFDAGGYAGVYLQARNSQQLWIASSTPDSNGNTVTKTSTPTPPATDDSTQIANTSWVRTNYQEKGYAGIDGAVVNSDDKVTDKDGNVVDALYFKVASLTTEKAYMRTYLLAEVAMTNIVKEQATVLIRCTTESSTSAPNVTITFDNYSYASLLLPKNIFVTADYKSGTAGATFTVWVKQDKNFMQQVWNVLSQNTRNYTTTSKREWRVFYSNITKATAVTDINAAPTGYTRIVANNNNRYSNLEENTYLWQQSQNAGITWKRYSDNTTRGVFRHYDDGTTENFVTQSDGFLFRPLNNNNTKSIKVDPAVGALYPEKDLGADLGKTAQRWNNGYITNIKGCKVINGGDDNLTINGTTTVATPPNKDNSNRITTTAWAGRRYKSIADFGFTSQTTVKAIVQKIIDNWYEYCTFACTNDDFNNFSDTPDGYGTLIIEVGSNALRPFISFTKQIGDSDSYKHWQANIVRGENNQVTEIQWYEIINSNLPQTISGAKTFTKKISISTNNNPDCSLIDTGLLNGTSYPTATRGAQVVGRDQEGLAMTAWRGWVSKEGYTSSQLFARSFGTDYSNYVGFYAKPNAPTYDETSAETKNQTGANSPNIWFFAPNKNDRFDFGGENSRWLNGYITNIQRCKVINGGGGNSLIQQNSDTAGADITVGSTNCALKMLGKSERPTYRQGKNGTYANLALQSDIKNGTLTIQRNAAKVATFTANQSGNSIADIEVPTALSELEDDMKVIVNNTAQSNAWAFAGGGHTVSASSTANSCVAIGTGSQTRYEKSIRIGTALGQTPKNQSVTQIGVNNYTSSGRALYLGAGYAGFTYMNAAGSSWASASDIRDKTDIEEINHALDFIKKLKPITYVMNDRERYLIRDKDDNPILDENGKQQYDVEAHKRGDKKKHRRFAGLSAQDTYQAMLDCYNNDTNYAQIVDNNKFDHPDDEYLEQYSMSYERLVPFLIKAVQEQQVQIDALKNKIAS